MGVVRCLVAICWILLSYDYQVLIPAAVIVVVLAVLAVDADVVVPVFVLAVVCDLLSDAVAVGLLPMNAHRHSYFKLCFGVQRGRLTNAGVENATRAELQR